MSQLIEANNDVVDSNGVRGKLTNETIEEAGATHIIVSLEGRQRVAVPIVTLVELKGGGYFFPHSFTEVAQHQSGAAAVRQHTQAATAGGTTEARQQNQTLVVPVIAEEIHVDKQVVESGRVRVTKSVQEREETIDLPLLVEETEINRVPVNQMVEQAPPVRYEGDTLIVPLLEEVIVTEKRLMLREELHITKRSKEVSNPQQVVVRREEAHIERVDAHESEST